MRVQSGRMLTCGGDCTAEVDKVKNQGSGGLNVGGSGFDNAKIRKIFEI